MTTTDVRRLPVSALEAFTASALIHHGLPQTDADTVAKMMIEADLHGADAHGLFRLPRYIDRLKAGGFNRTPNIRIDRSKGGLARVDGDGAMGHLVVQHCADEAIARAAEYGVSWVGCHNSNHAGAAGVWAMRPVPHDMIGIYMAVGSANHMAPWGGTEALLSTNPIAIGIPGGDDGPVLLDMATTNAAYGKVKMAAATGQDMPEGWMIDAQGQPLTDPTRAGSGTLLPIGGPKGYGLALMIGLLAGTLNGAALGRDLVDFNADDVTPTNTGQSILVIDLNALGAPELFKRQVDQIRQELTSSDTRPDFDAIRLPGDRALALRAERRALGVPCPPVLMDALNLVAHDAGLSPLEF